MMHNLLLGICLCFVGIATVSADLGPQIQIGERVLQLNGSGVRTKSFVQVYKSGLYLLKPSKDAQTVLAVNELIGIRIQVTTGFVSQASLVSSLKEGLAQAYKGKPDALAGETAQLQQLLQDEVKKADNFDFVNEPTQGLFVLKNQKAHGVIPGLEFKKAFFGIWLSDSPVDKTFARRCRRARGTPIDATEPRSGMATFMAKDLNGARIRQGSI